LGGEPLVYKDLFKLFKKHKDSFFQFYTNGTLLTEKIIKELVAIGNAVPMLSIEGWEKQTDERRGKGVYTKLMRAMDIMKKYKLPFGISVAVTNKNAAIISSDKFMKFIVGKGAFFVWWFLYMPIGREPDLSLMPTAKQRKMLFERGKDIREKYPIFLIDFWNDAPKVGGCIAGKQYMHITSKGDVEPCIFTHFAADNVHKKSLLEIMDSDYFKALRKMQPYNDNLFMPCMWIDNPEVARDVHKKYGVYPTHPDAEFIITSEKTIKHIDKYSKEVEAEFSKLWSDHCKECKKCE
jgi:MoaA/NifB/PqqE/SkfB family radical SAM enzyme